MSDERMQALLDTWFRDRDEPARDVGGDIASVMADVPRTHQQGRWLPLPVFHRKAKAKTPTTNDMTVYQPGPIPATNSHVPVVIGRTQTMFSPAKAIIAGAIVFALGGLFLVAQPFSQQGSVPGAEQPAASSERPVDLMAPAAVTVTESNLQPVGYPSMDVDDAGVTHYRDIEGAGEWVASDPRLSGAATYHGAWDEFVGGSSIETNTYEVVNDEGSWFGPATAVTANGEHVELIVLKGEGGYEGLTAYVVGGVSLGDTVFGVIFPGEPIPMPERSPAP